jgi:hypothetical protein
MSEPISPQAWKTLYTAAMLESDKSQLRHRIESADAAMQSRLKELPGKSPIRSEQTELQSALNYLRRLKDILSAELC